MILKYFFTMFTFNKVKVTKVSPVKNWSTYSTQEITIEFLAPDRTFRHIFVLTMYDNQFTDKPGGYYNITWIPHMMYRSTDYSLKIISYENYKSKHSGQESY